MSTQLIYERFLWFHERVKASAFPNAAKLAERFEISAKTAQRAIEFMRLYYVGIIFCDNHWSFRG